MTTIWHVWHQPPHGHMWLHEGYRTEAEAEESVRFWLLVGHQAQIRESTT